ncbi:MAG: hypothetical protein JWO89_1947, partial [Verrucomicrobiaceae bacterium]|nr:hypothetical protein [Verrucomicrobiaceae bacterium]
SGDYGSQDDSKRELAAELAAVFGFSACANQDKVGLVLFSDEVEAFVPARKGLSHTLRIVRDILNATPRSRKSNFKPALDVALQRIAHRSLIILISDFLVPGTDWEHSLRGVAAKHDVTAVQVADPRELDLPKAGRVCLQDPETGEQVVLNTSSQAVRLLYEQRISAHFDSVSQALRRCGVESVKASTGDNYVPALKAYFRARRKKR